MAICSRTSCLGNFGLALRIEDYGLIGDCHSAALVGRDGSIDWLCWPSFDSDACFSALLGNKWNGRWLIAPQAREVAISRRYRGDTLILETRFETGEGVVTLTDFMPPGAAVPSLVRIVRCESGRVKMRMEMIVRFGFGKDVPWVRRIADDALLAVCGPDMVVLRTAVATRGRDFTTVASFDVAEGDVIPFVLAYEASHREVPPPLDCQRSFAETERFWASWGEKLLYDGMDRSIVLRSLIVLKALIFMPTGGMVAAPTTSLPETLGGARNWDYRFCWLRDATFTLLALMNSGYFEEATAWHHWLYRSVAGSPAEMQIMYGLSGQRRLMEWEAAWLPGYEGARPVRIGNAAYDQLQLDVYGELMDVFYQFRNMQPEQDSRSWALEIVLLAHLTRIWREPDCGIWERRDRNRHYVSSKALSWVAFDRGIKTAEKFGFEAPIEEWRAQRDAILRDVCEHGFDEEQQSFVEAYGSPLLDASVLLLPIIGFLPADDPRIQGTVRAIESRMMNSGFVMRHDPREASMNTADDNPSELSRTDPSEGAFLACTLWLADVYVLAGRIDDAAELLERVAAIANDLGLLAEEYDLQQRRQCGNYPQALTHIALINTAHNISAARKPVMQRAHRPDGRFSKA